MPAKSEKQRKFMQAVAHSPSFAKKVGVPQSVGREYSKAKGGEMAESKQMMRKEVAFMKKKGAPQSMVKHEEAEAKGMKRGGSMKKYAAGGLTGGHKSADGIAKKGKTKARKVAMAKGGYRMGGSQKGC